MFFCSFYKPSHYGEGISSTLSREYRSRDHVVLLKILSPLPLVQRPPTLGGKVFSKNKSTPPAKSPYIWRVCDLPTVYMTCIYLHSLILIYHVNRSTLLWLKLMLVNTIKLVKNVPAVSKSVKLIAFIFQSLTFMKNYRRYAICLANLTL